MMEHEINDELPMMEDDDELLAAPFEEEKIIYAETLENNFQQQFSDIDEEAEMKNDDSDDNQFQDTLNFRDILEQRHYRSHRGPYSNHHD